MAHKKPEKDRLEKVNIRLSQEHVNHLKRLCIDMSYRDKKTVNITKLIRETLLQAYPIPKNTQLDMFGGK
jgi:hypothetical protein